jgi:hypothetical protein
MLWRREKSWPCQESNPALLACRQSLYWLSYPYSCFQHTPDWLCRQIIKNHYIITEKLHDGNCSDHLTSFNLSDVLLLPVSNHTNECKFSFYDLQPLFLFSFTSFPFEVMPKWTSCFTGSSLCRFETSTGVFIYASRYLTVIHQSQYAMLWLVFSQLYLILDYHGCYVLCALDCLFKPILQITLICFYDRVLQASWNIL